MVRKQKAGDGGRKLRLLLVLVFPQERQVWGRVNSLILASFNNFGKFQAIGVFSSCLVPGPGMIKAEAYCFLEYTGQTEEVWI